MKTTFRREIRAAAEANRPQIEAVARTQFGVDLNDRARMQTFLKIHPDFMLPDLYLDMGNSQNIYINYHDPIFNELPHAHNFFELIYVAEGTAGDYIDDTAIELKTGEMCLHNPRARHMVTHCGPEDFLVNILISKDIFEDEVFAQIARDPELDRFFHRYLSAPDSSPAYMAFHDVDAMTGQILDMIFEEYFHEDRSELLISSLLTLLFGNLLRGHKGDPFTEELADYISEHLADITVRSAANHFGYHEKYFSGLVREKTGRSFKQHVMEQRMRRAAHLLQYTEDTIEELASAVGYAEPSSLYTNFRAMYGCSPREWRLTHKTIK